MIAALLLASAITTANTTVRPLSAGSSIRDSLAGHEQAVFSIGVPAATAAEIVVVQQGVDVEVILRHAGSDLPEHGLDMVAGPNGVETRYVEISDAPATWNVFVRGTLPRQPRGDFTISLETHPADDHDRAVAKTRRLYQEMSDLDWLGTTEKTETMCMAVAEQAAANGDRELEAEATYQAARRHDVLGDVPGAMEWQKRALAMFRELGRRDRESRALNRLGDYSRKVGDVRESEEYFREALPIARETGDRIAEVDILNNASILMFSTGRAEEALEQLQAAIPLAQELGSANVEVALWSNAGDAYRFLGMPDKALQAYERAAERVLHSDLPQRRVGRALAEEARAYFENGDRTKAESTIRDGIDILEKAGDANYTAEAYTLHGEMQFASGDVEAAVESFGRALPLLQKGKIRGGQIDVLSKWAEADLDRGDADSALKKIDEALQLSREIARRHSEAQALYLRARALQKKNDIAGAIDSVSRAIGLVENMRETIVHREMRTSYFATVRGYYDLQIDLLQRQGRTVAAFDASERARARTLLESLAESASQIRKGVDPKLLQRERELQAELNAKDVYRAQVVLKEGERSARATSIGSRIDRLVEEWNDIESKIRASSPAYASLKMPEPVDVREVQSRLLDAGTALIAYHLGDRQSLAWVIDRKTITVHKLAPEGDIDRLARRYHELLSREPGSMTAAERAANAQAIASEGRKLSAIVWKPLRSRVQRKRLLVVADGALQYVPFDALPSASGEPLIVRHEIVNLPSASVLDFIRRNPRAISKNPAVAVFADPVFARDDPRVTGTATVERVAETRGGPYTRLRFSRQEAEAIAKAGGPRTFEALDFDAAKKTIAERDLRRFDILHFATHGYLDTDEPELSGLVLSLVDSSGKPVDGFLHLAEIYNLDLNAGLVVLSACRTALGKEVYGEGLIGLTRGFMFAGASRVVSSVWNVDDRASALLMARFYGDMLSKRMPAAAALRQAQLSLLREPRWSSPHYWAAFGLQGDWR